jgi:hypothetical protein
LIAPLFHHFYPGHTFYSNPSSLVMVLAFFQWIRLSYPGFKMKLQQTLERSDVDSMMKVPLKDLQFLCEFAIPTVNALLYTKLISMFIFVYVVDHRT